MSRYLILLILNLPLILTAIFGAFVSYKLRRLSLRRFLSVLLFWLIILVGLAASESIYQWLFSRDLTRTEPLSLFDVVQITMIIGLLYVVGRSRVRLDVLEDKVGRMNSEVSIELSGKSRERIE